MSKVVVVRFSMRVSGGGLPENFAASIPVEMSFEGCDLDTACQIASRSLRIDLQRVLRTKTPEYLDEVAKKGLKINWTEAGQQIKTREDKIKELVAAGMPEKLAVMFIDDPTKFAKFMESIG